MEPSGKAHQLPILDDLREPAKLRAAYDKLSVAANSTMHLVFDPDERAWLQTLVEAVWPMVTFGLTAPGARNYPKGAVVEMGVTDRYHRAIAKLGFHYFLTQFPAFHGSEPCFSEIRNFISEDGSPVTLANSFIGEREHSLLGEMLGGERPDGWVAHVLAADIAPEGCLAHVQLFVCEDYRPRVYTVRLADRTDDGPIDARGHAYVYFEKGPEGKFSGAARVLTWTRVPTEPPPLKPVVG